MYLSKFSNVLLNCVTKSLLDIAQIGEGIRQPKLILTLFNSFPSTWWGENSLGISIWNSKLQALQTKRYTIHRKKNTCLLKFTKMTSENRQFKMHSKLLTLKCLLLLMWMWMKKCFTATILLRLHEGQWGPDASTYTEHTIPFLAIVYLLTWTDEYSMHRFDERKISFWRDM